MVDRVSQVSDSKVSRQADEKTPALAATTATRTLENGTTLIAVSCPHLSQVSLCAALRVGPRYEAPEKNGISHFLEHMMFRGCGDLADAHAVALAFEALGGTLEGATHIEHGELCVTVPKSSALAAIRHLTSVLRDPRFSDIELEKGIVEEELMEELGDDGLLVDGDALLRDLAFAPDPLALPISGTLETLRHFGDDDLRAHHAKHYTGRNLVVTAAGAIDDTERFLDELSSFLAPLPAGALASKGIGPAGSQKRSATASFRHVDHPASQVDLHLGFRAPARSDVHENATEMLLRVLDDGMSTRLYHRVCDERGLCYDVSAEYEAFEDAGLVDIAASVQPSRAAALVEVLVATLTELATSGPSEQELVKATNRHAWEAEAMFDRPEDLARHLSGAALHRRPPCPFERNQALRAVTQDDVRNAAERILTARTTSCVVVGELTRGERAAIRRQLANLP